MALASILLNSGCFLKGEARLLKLRSRDACFPDPGASAALSPRITPSSKSRGYGCRVDANPKKSVWSAHLPPLSNTPHAMNVTAEYPDDPQKLYVDGFMGSLRKLWDSFPQPVRSFPWSKVLIHFYRLILELTWAVAKYLCVPVLAVSSLSEMSYFAQERRMVLLPVPLIAGFAIVGALKDTAMELSPDLKEGVFPGHLLMIAIFFVLIKLPGPHYPYWGRLFIPHFANGGLWGTIWSAFMWYRMPRGSSGPPLEVSVDGILSGDEKH